MTGERILIMSSGANIDKTYPVTAEYFKPTHVFVIVEKNIYEPPKATDSKFLSNEKPLIRTAIENVERMVSEYPDRQYKLINIEKLTQEEIQAAVLSIRNDHTDAQYCFNVTGGTAIFSTTLLLMGVWFGGIVCITRTNEPLIELTIPKLSLKDLEENKELRRIILAIGDGTISNKKLAKELGYIALESDRIKNNDKVILTRTMKKLLDDWKLVKEEKKGREVFYSLTRDGIFAYHFFMRDEAK